MNDSSIGYIICESDMDIKPTAVKKEGFNGKAIADGVLQTANERNRNGRFYDRNDLFPQIEAPRTVELLKAGYLRAEVGHPLSKDLQRQSIIDDTVTCARFLNLWTEGDNIMGTFCATNNQYGKAFDLDLKEGCFPAWSLRALGSIKKTSRGAEVKNIRVITWDNVIYPSHPGAYTKSALKESYEANSDSSLVTESVLFSSDDIIAESAKSFVIPVTNESVVNFIKSQSNNLKFVRECFDFAYSSIHINENGSKVLLTNNDGDTICINMENYIHNELMNYAASKLDYFE